ncbi:unnamed protein product [Schistosoma margrebowiei]|uniref:Uncharacterized protein n=1 Tax=Schistosoma margrebowiei TaxID=48269 RepID=A0A183MJ76_9TREM|nr:unnamed protein product [Schistosoma margrebowiei]
MVADDQRLFHTPFIPSEYWNLCEPLVWNQSFPTPLGGYSISTNSIQVSDIRFSSFQFRKQHTHHEKAISTTQEEHGIQWTDWVQLDYLDFLDDLGILFHEQKQIQVNTASTAATSASVGFNIRSGKSKILKYDTENANPLTLDRETLGQVDTFTYLDADVKVWIGKTRTAFLQLKNIWNSKQLSANIEIRIIKTKVKTVLL